MILEICAQSEQAALTAFECGAHRIELCIDLPSGGLTPPYSLVKTVIKAIGIPVFPLIRCRAGDFIYSQSEMECMADQIRYCVDAGASGLVLGALDENFTINRNALDLWLPLVQGKPVTFHRAIELVADLDTAINTLKEYQIKRILTGGKLGHAYNSRMELAEINKKHKDQIILLAGSGVSSENVVELLKVSGCTEIHTSAKYGSKSPATPYDSDPIEVKKIVALLEQIDL